MGRVHGVDRVEPPAGGGTSAQVPLAPEDAALAAEPPIEPGIPLRAHLSAQAHPTTLDLVPPAQDAMQRALHVKGWQWFLDLLLEIVTFSAAQTSSFDVTQPQLRAAATLIGELPGFGALTRAQQAEVVARSVARVVRGRKVLSDNAEALRRGVLDALGLSDIGDTVTGPRGGALRLPPGTDSAQTTSATPTLPSAVSPLTPRDLPAAVTPNPSAAPPSAPAIAVPAPTSAPASASPAGPAAAHPAFLIEHFAFDEHEFFEHLDGPPFGVVSAEEMIAYEAGLLDRADDALVVLAAPVTAYADDLRTQAAKLLLYTAAMMIVVEEAALAGHLSYEQMIATRNFAMASGHNAFLEEITERRDFMVRLFEAVQRVDKRALVQSFVDGSYARLELRRTGAVDDDTFERMMQLIETQGIFALMTAVTAFHPDQLTPEQRQALADKTRGVVSSLSRSSAELNTGAGSKAPWATEATKILLADTLMRDLLENGDFKPPTNTLEGVSRHVSHMFGGLGAAAAMYESALESTTGELPPWPRELLEERLTRTRAAQNLIWGQSPYTQDELLRWFESQHTSASSCINCHAPR